MTPAEMLGARAATIRESRGLSQAQVGQELGPLLGKPWPRQTVSSAEKGNRAFTVTELVALALVLETPLATLLAPPLELRELEMPSGVRVSRDELDALVAFGADATGRWETMREFGVGSQKLRKALDRAAELTTSWSESDRKRLAEVNELYEMYLSALQAVAGDDDDDET